MASRTSYTHRTQRYTATVDCHHTVNQTSNKHHDALHTVSVPESAAHSKQNQTQCYKEQTIENKSRYEVLPSAIGGGPLVGPIQRRLSIACHTNVKSESAIIPGGTVQREPRPFRELG